MRPVFMMMVTPLRETCKVISSHKLPSSDGGSAIIYLSSNKPSELPPAQLSQQAEKIYRQTLDRRQPQKTTTSDIISFEAEGSLHLVYRLSPTCRQKDPHLTHEQKLIGQVISTIKSFEPLQIAVDLSALPDEVGSNELRVTEKLIFGLCLAYYPLPCYQSDHQPQKIPPLHVSGTCATKCLDKATGLAMASNAIRHLMMEPANILTPRSFVHFVQKDSLAVGRGLSSIFYSYDRLKKKGAGAFCAVAGGNPHSGSGIVAVSYVPEDAVATNKSVAFVGKGITYDVGGVNVKPARYMKGMHHDMTGAALAYALVKLAAHHRWPIKVTAYLALADNVISASAYKPDDVITSLSGKTIEVVHTDAEGRMVLADTLTLASRDHHDLIMNFATLTGASTAAISDKYHSIYTTQPEWHPIFTAASHESGERVWPFPLDKDFADCLKSRVADTKQCRLTGGVDHIEAALFLTKFVIGDVPLIHMDLSHATTEKAHGLHLSKETGAGPAFVSCLLKKLGFI